MNFDWSLFEFTARDSQLLANGLKATPTLRVFRLNRSKVGDQKGRLIISHLLDHPSLSVLGVCMYVCSCCVYCTVDLKKSCGRYKSCELLFGEVSLSLMCTGKFCTQLRDGGTGKVVVQCPLFGGSTVL